MRRTPWWLALALGIVLLLVSAPVEAVAAPSQPVVPLKAQPATSYAQSGSPGIGAGAASAAGAQSAQPNLPCEGCTPDPPCYPTYEYCYKFFVTCAPSITKDVSRSIDLETGEAYSRIHWTAAWDCSTNYYTAHAQIGAQVGLYDRTPGHDDLFLGYSGSVSGTDHASSSGDIFLYDNDFPGMQQIELVMDTTLQMTGVSSLNTWKECRSISPLRYSTPCVGLGTQFLTLGAGTGNFGTGIGEKSRGGCYWPDRGYSTLGEQNGYAVFGFWGMQRCTGSGAVGVSMEVGLYRADGGAALVTWRGEGQVTQANPLVLGKGQWLGNFVRVGDEVKIIISTTLRAPGAASWSSDSTPSHHCVGDGTDTLHCTDTFPKFKVPR